MMNNINRSPQQHRTLSGLAEPNYLQHVAVGRLAWRSSPKLGWTYVDEDFMGRIAQLAV